MTAPKDILLDIGGFHFGGGKTRIRTLLGSCVAITLWHPRLRIGGMCHYMLPAAADGGRRLEPEGMYGEAAVRLFCQAITKACTLPADYVVRIFGGGRMFGKAPEPGIPVPAAAAALDVAARNIQAGKELLRDNGFVISAEDVGGSGFRQIAFELWNGEILVRRGPELP